MESGRSRKLNPGSLTVGPQCLPSMSQGRGSGFYSFKERSKIMPSFVEHLLPGTHFKIHILIFNPPNDLSGTIITNCPAQKSSGQGGTEPHKRACQGARSAGCVHSLFSSHPCTPRLPCSPTHSPTQDCTHPPEKYRPNGQRPPAVSN